MAFEETSEIFEGQVSGLAFGGQGIVRLDGLVVFVPFTAPGEHVRFRLRTRKKNFAEGQLIEVVQASPARTAPVCPYFGTCGGCQLQHIDYATQLDYKRQSIEDALHRIAGMPDAAVPPVQAATQRWHYRRRITLTLKPHQGRFKAGYLATDSHSLVLVNECAIFIPKEDSLIADVQSVAGMLDNPHEQSGKVLLLKEEAENGGYLLHFQFDSLPKNLSTVMQAALAAHESWSGILVTTRRETLTFGALTPKISVEELSFAFSPQAFIQNHPEQSLNIYRSIVTHAKALAPGKILDLYCGIGISSLLLASHGFHVTGVESSPAAIKMAQANAAANALKDKAAFVQADVQHVLPKLLKKEHPELVVVNPPRTGLDANVVRALLDNPPRAILYISCMPPTLARDLKRLCENKFYRLQSVEAYDMFPQTAHVETLARLG